MTVREAIEARRSVRAYTPEPVSREDLMRVLEAVRLAPSWKDKQCWNVIVLSDREEILRLGELLRWNPGRSVYDDAPLFLVFTADPAMSGERDGKPYYMTDVGIAMHSGVLAAQELGLGTCWVGAFTEEPVRELLGVPPTHRIVAITPLGHPAEHPAPRPRKPMEAIAFDGVWGKPLV